MVRGEIEGSERELSFPKLMIGARGVIVLMIKHGVGVVVCRNGSPHTVGEYADNWSMNTFEDYTGSVTITNEED